MLSLWRNWLIRRRSSASRSILILLRDEHEPPGQVRYALQRGDRMRGPITLPSGAAAGRPLGLLTYRGSWLGRIAVLSGIAYLLLSSPSVSVAQEPVRQGTEATSGQQVFNNLCRTCHSKSPVARHPLADWDLRLFSKEIIKMGRQARAVVDRLRCKSPVESNAYA